MVQSISKNISIYLILTVGASIHLNPVNLTDFRVIIGKTIISLHIYH